MQELERVSGLRGVGDPPRVAYVVTDAGQIKSVRYDVNVMSPLITVEMTRIDGRVTAIGEVDVAPTYRRKGFRMLREHYENSDQMEDWAVWCDYQAAGRAGKLLPAFPEDRLPSTVLELRRAAPEKAAWVPPEKKEAKRVSGRKGQAQLA